MIEEDLNQREAKLQNYLAETISKELKIPVNRREIIESVLEQVKQIPGIEKKYLINELREEVQDFVRNFMFMRPKDEVEEKNRIEGFLVSIKKEKNYEATIILPSVSGLPIGTKIGTLEIVEQKIEDENLLIGFLEYKKRHSNIYIDGCSQARVLFSTYNSVNITNTFYKILELPFAILSLLLDFDLDPRDCIGAIKSLDISSIIFLEPQRERIGLSMYSKHYDEYLERLSKISIHRKPNPLQQKILQALQVYGLSRLSQKTEIRFLFLVSSFESLLLTNNDRDYLGQKLSEKTAFLLESEYEKRLKVYKQMKSFYGKRSGLVHGGQKQILEQEVRTLENIFQAVVFKLLELSESYTKMEQRARESEQEGIEDLINKHKFS